MEHKLYPNGTYWPEDHIWCGCPDCGECLCERCNQPKRSKREDPKCCDLIYVEYSDSFKKYGLKDGYQRLKPDGMRCSEHCGNTVMEAQ